MSGLHPKLLLFFCFPPTEVATCSPRLPIFQICKEATICKAAGDRKAATIKSHMRIHLNAGNDIETPVQMRDAILSCRGVPAANVVLCEYVEVSCESSAKLEEISQLRYVQFEESALRVWSAYQLDPGAGKAEYPVHIPAFGPY